MEYGRVFLVYKSAEAHFFLGNLYMHFFMKIIFMDFILSFVQIFSSDHTRRFRFVRSLE